MVYKLDWHIIWTMVLVRLMAYWPLKGGRKALIGVFDKNVRGVGISLCRQLFTFSSVIPMDRQTV